MKGTAGLAIGLHAVVAVSCSGPSDSSSSPMGPPAGREPPALPTTAATEHVPLSREVIEGFRTLDTGRIAAVSHSTLRPAFAASTLSPSDWRVQVAARSPGPTEARTNGITWLVSIGEKAPGVLAVLRIQREGEPLVFWGLDEIPRSAFESFGTPPPWVPDPSTMSAPPVPGGPPRPK